MFFSLSRSTHALINLFFKEWSLIISGGKDGKVIIWDLNRLCYVRSLKFHNTPVSSIAISPTTGDIVTVGYRSALEKPSKDDKNNSAQRGTSFICLWSINGDLLKTASCNEKINCIAMTHGTEGLSRNILIAGLDNGNIKIWDAFDLQPLLVNDLKEEALSSSSPVTALCVSADCTQFFSGHANGTLVAWSARKASNPTQLIRNLTMRRKTSNASSSSSKRGITTTAATQQQQQHQEKKEPVSAIREERSGGQSKEDEEEEDEEEEEPNNKNNNNDDDNDNDNNNSSTTTVESPVLWIESEEDESEDGGGSGRGNGGGGEGKTAE